MRAERRLAVAVALLNLALPATADVVLTEGTNIAADVSPVDGRVALSLLDSLWLLSPRGGEAERLTPAALAADRPRWSPDGSQLLFASRANGARVLRLLEPGSGEGRQLTPHGETEQAGDWHPSGERVVYAAARHGSGLDLWERDLATGLAWRLTSSVGDETDPAWSADGRHLTWIRRDERGWQLWLRRFGRPPTVVYESDSPLHAPAWRPDNTLITFLAGVDDGLELRMAILSSPPLVRTLATGEDFFRAPVSWIDRQRMLYTADGRIRTRGFEDRNGRELAFRTLLPSPASRAARRSPRERLPALDAAPGRSVLRVPRLYDGNGEDYRRDVDIVMEGGRIAAIEPRRPRDDLPVIEVGNVAALPGLIDVYGRYPDVEPRTADALLLGFGVTTLVAPDLPPGRAAAAAAHPQPRLLAAVAPSRAGGAATTAGLVSLVTAEAPAARPARLAEWQRRGVPVLASGWRNGLAAGADLVLGSGELPLSPAGRHYADIERLLAGGPLTLVSAMSGPGDSAVGELAGLPPARWLDVPSTGPRYLANARSLDNGTGIVVGSHPSGLPAGLATQAELRALVDAGLSPAAALRAATRDAAAALGYAGQLGELAPGRVADILLVAGDPLADIRAAGEVVAVIRDGRFMSIAGLLDTLPPPVE